MDLSRLPREELEGLDRRAVESDMKKYLEKFFEKVSRDLVWWKSLTSVSCGLCGVFFICFIVVATIAGPPDFDEEQLADMESDSDEDDLADLR